MHVSKMVSEVDEVFAITYSKTCLTAEAYHSGAASGSNCFEIKLMGFLSMAQLQ